MLKVLQTEFIINKKHKESLIYEGYIQLRKETQRRQEENYF